MEQVDNQQQILKAIAYWKEQIEKAKKDEDEELLIKLYSEYEHFIFNNYAIAKSLID